MLKKLYGKYANLKFKISPLFIVYVIFFTVLGKTYESFSYIVALVIHEFAHSEEARKRGYTLNGMLITIFGASLKMDVQSMKSEDERAIALAGPLTNLCLAIFCTALWWTFPSTYFFTLDFVWANLSLLIFNLLPVYPLDGGRITLSLLKSRMKEKNAYKVLKILGITISISLVIGSVITLFLGVFNLSLFLVGIFTSISTLFPERKCKYERLYKIGYRHEKLKRGLPVREIAVLPTTTVQNAYKLLSADKYTCFVLVDKNLIPRSIVPETIIEKYYDKDCTLLQIADKT